MISTTARRWFWLFVVFAAGVVAPGCGDSKGLIRVTGQVSFGGKSPPAVGYVYFVPRAMSTNQRRDRSGPLVGTAIFSKDGAFAAGTFTTGDGLRPGTYEVRVACESADARRHTGSSDVHTTANRSLVPAGCTLPDLIVPSNSRKPLQFDIDVR